MFTKGEVRALVADVAEALFKDIAINTVAAAAHPDTTEAEIRVKAGERNGVIRFRAALEMEIQKWEDIDDD